MFFFVSKFFVLPPSVGLVGEYYFFKNWCQKWISTILWGVSLKIFGVKVHKLWNRVYTVHGVQKITAKMLNNCTKSSFLYELQQYLLQWILRMGFFRQQYISTMPKMHYPHYHSYFWKQAQMAFRIKFTVRGWKKLVFEPSRPTRRHWKGQQWRKRVLEAIFIICF